MSALAFGSSCTSTIGPYVRNIEVKPNGAVVVERCTSLVTDYALGGTIDNDPGYCDQNVLPIPSGGSRPEALPAVAAPVYSPPPAPMPAPVAPPAPPPPPASPPQIMTPPGVAPGVAPQPKVATPAAPATQPGQPQPAPGTVSACPIGMVQLPGGSFAMGDRKDRVKVNKFCMDATEVTADAYTSCIRNGQCTTEGLNCGAAATYGALGRGSHPINCVDFGQASTYCQSIGKRLPTEEEWEWAARGGALGKTYPWGNVEPSSQVCWSGYGQMTGTCEAGAYVTGASPQGIFDLAGNVWEWTSGQKDPTSPERIARGGAWSSTGSSYLRAAERYWTMPTYRFIYIGFRCVK